MPPGSPNKSNAVVMSSSSWLFHSLRLMWLSISSVNLVAVGGVAEQAFPQIFHGQVVFHAEAGAGSPKTSADPGEEPNSNSCQAAKAEVGVLDESHTNIEEHLLETRDCELGLDLRGRNRDLANSFEDRCAGGNNVVASDSRVPVAASLEMGLALVRYCGGRDPNSRPRR